VQALRVGQRRRRIGRAQAAGDALLDQREPLGRRQAARRQCRIDQRHRLAVAAASGQRQRVGQGRRVPRPAPAGGPRRSGRSAGSGHTQPGATRRIVAACARGVAPGLRRGADPAQAVPPAAPPAGSARRVAAGHAELVAVGVAQAGAVGVRVLTGRRCGGPSSRLPSAIEGATPRASNAAANPQPAAQACTSAHHRRSRGNAGPPQASSTPTQGGPGAARPWGALRMRGPCAGTERAGAIRGRAAADPAHDRPCRAAARSDRAR